MNTWNWFTDLIVLGHFLFLFLFLFFLKAKDQDSLQTLDYVNAKHLLLLSMQKCPGFQGLILFVVCNALMILPQPFSNKLNIVFSFVLIFRLIKEHGFYYWCNTSIHRMKMVFTLCRCFLICQWSMVKVKQVSYCMQQTYTTGSVLHSVDHPMGGLVQLSAWKQHICVTVSPTLAVFILQDLMHSNSLVLRPPVTDSPFDLVIKELCTCL